MQGSQHVKTSQKSPIKCLPGQWLVERGSEEGNDWGESAEAFRFGDGQASGEFTSFFQPVVSATRQHMQWTSNET